MSLQDETQACQDSRLAPSLAEVHWGLACPEAHRVNLDVEFPICGIMTGQFLILK